MLLLVLEFWINPQIYCFVCQGLHATFAVLSKTYWSMFWDLRIIQVNWFIKLVSYQIFSPEFLVSFLIEWKIIH